MIGLDVLLEHLRDNLRSAVDGVDVEGVHQVRVATRRIDSWLELGGRKSLRDDLRWLRRRASALRDLDVMLSREGLPSGLRRKWESSRAKAHRELVLAAESARLSGLMEALAILPPIEESEARARIPAIRDRVLRRGQRFCESPTDAEALHRLRRGVRRLRYALEWLGDDSKPLRRLQESLGAANDAVVALVHVDRDGTSPESFDYREKTARKLSGQIADVREDWASHRDWIAGVGRS